MKKRVPGFRGFAVKTVLMLAALSVMTLSLRASLNKDALLEVLSKRNVISQGYVLVFDVGNGGEQALEPAVVPLRRVEVDIFSKSSQPKVIK